MREALPHGENWDDGHAGTALAQLVQAFDSDAGLHDLGRWIVRRYLVNLLRSRALAMRAWDRDPHIVQAPVNRPVVIVGLPRTGTTLLYNLLAGDPNSRPLMAWESLLPGFAGRSKTRRTVRLLRFAVPELHAIHPLRASGPEECTWLMAHSFVSPVFLMGAYLDSYRQWLWSLSASELCPGYELYRRLLQLLQWRRGGGRWLLKSPSHLLALDVLMSTFPDARVIYLHRDLRQAIPSGCSLFAVTHSHFTDDVSTSALGAAYTETCANLVRRASAVRDQHAESVFDVHYQELIRQPLAVVRRIYEFLEQPLRDQTARQMTAWLHRDAHTRRSVHHYSLAQFGLSEERLTETFGKEQLHFEAGTDLSCRT